MNNQYLQWISGPRRGEVESIEMMQDGQTFEDVVILPNGKRIAMSKVGKEFIILPSANAALPQFDLDMMYPNEQKKSSKQSAPKDHSDILGFDPAQNEKPINQPVKQPKKQSSFASDLFSRSKKIKTKIHFDLNVDMPSSSFFSMLHETFDEETINEVIDIIIDSIDQTELKNSIRRNIIYFYGE